jgi:hypothetical protein
MLGASIACRLGARTSGSAADPGQARRADPPASSPLEREARQLSGNACVMPAHRTLAASAPGRSKAEARQKLRKKQVG